MSGVIPKVHSVHFYESQDALIGRLCGIVCSGLLIGNSILIIATDEHRFRLVESLEKLQIDIEDHTRAGRVSMCDAEEVLSTFMVDNVPEPLRFLSSMRHLLGAKAAGRSNDGRALTVFGEMVAVLWEQGNQRGALALEELWNDMLNENAFHLHCAYPRWMVGKDEAGMRNICECHSHVLGMIAPAA